MRYKSKNKNKKGRILCENCRCEVDNYDFQPKGMRYMTKDIFPKCYNELDAGYYVIDGDENFIQDKYMQYKFGMDNFWPCCITNSPMTSDLHYAMPSKTYNAAMNIKEVYNDETQQKIIDNIMIEDDDLDEEDDEEIEKKRKKKIITPCKCYKDVVNVAILLLILMIILLNY